MAPSQNYCSSSPTVVLFFYGCIALLSDNKTFLRKLDVVQNKILRTILGAFRSTPVPQLYFESGVIPLSIRCLWLGAKYLINLSENQNNPAFHTIFSLISSNTSFRSPTSPSEIRLHYALLEKSIKVLHLPTPTASQENFPPRKRFPIDLLYFPHSIKAALTNSSLASSECIFL